MEKGILVKDIIAGRQIEGIFVIRTASLGKTHAGDPFWTLCLGDATGSIDAKIWQPLSREFREFQIGSFALILGASNLYKGKCQITVHRLDILDDAQKDLLALAEFMPSSPYPIGEMFSSLLELAQQEFTHKPWRDLVCSILQSDEIREGFCVAPAATGVHHAYAGGLLEHTLSVAELCTNLADRYPELDRQTLLAGAILHDIGKIRELTRGPGLEYTQEGKLLGHIFLGLELVEPFMASSGLEPWLAEHLRHLILSHHGQPEFGAPRLPQTAEALALHYADNMDAKLAQCRALFADNPGRPAWSGWQSTLGRAILLAQPTPAPDATGEDSVQDAFGSGNAEDDEWYPQDTEAEPAPEELAELYADPSFNDYGAQPGQAGRKTAAANSQGARTNAGDRQCSLL